MQTYLTSINKFLIIYFVLGQIGFAQLSNDTSKTFELSPPNGNNTKIKWEILAPVGVGIGAINYSMYKYYQKAWWGEERTKFHTFNDWNNADMNIDKVGHLYGGMALTKLSYKLYRLSNVPEGWSMFLSSFTSIFFQMQIEFHDAYFKKWGWSWWDVGANTLGAVYPNLQKMWTPLQTFNLKWSYHPSQAYKDGWFDYWIKDYHGFTYWLTFDVNSMLPKSIDKYWPDWLNLALGYGVERVKLGKNIWNSSVNPLGDREWYIAFDYDLVKLFNPKAEWLRELLETFNIIHFPSPAIRFSPSGIYYGLYF
ncbi:MAG: YfiM family protein [Bacteroidetes bacterium]|nr:YfiM family protein [Bacteroidota bacterium]MBU2584452.1 YfiM family protein [Bacteroidota bacterium]